MNYSTEEVNSIIETVKDSYTLIILDGDYDYSCIGCPSIYEFKDKGGNEYYFRYRNGWLSLRKNKQIMYDEKIGDDFDGFIRWSECCIDAFSRGIAVIDMDSEYQSWIESAEVEAELEE